MPMIFRWVTYQMVCDWLPNHLVSMEVNILKLFFIDNFSPLKQMTIFKNLFMMVSFHSLLY